MSHWVGAVAALILAAGAGASPARESARLDALYLSRGYLWHEAILGQSVQFGLPGSDDRVFRVDCSEGRIGLIGPAATDAGFGSPIEVSFANGDRRRGQVIELGDGPNFLVETTSGDPLLAWLLGQPRIDIAGPQVSVSVPTAGGVALLRSLIDRCRG